MFKSHFPRGNFGHLEVSTSIGEEHLMFEGRTLIELKDTWGLFLHTKLNWTKVYMIQWSSVHLDYAFGMEAVEHHENLHFG